MTEKNKTIVLIIVILGVLFIFFGNQFFYANADLSRAVEEKRERLEKELKENEKAQAELRGKISQFQAQGASLERDIALLSAEIRQAQLKIEEKNIIIQQLGKEIGQKEETIDSLEAKMKRSKESLAELIRKTNESDHYSLVEILLQKDDLSDFFVDVDAIDSVKRSLGNLFEEIRVVQGETKEEKVVLGQKQDAEIDARKEIEKQKRIIEEKEAQKQRLLDINKSTEQTYNSILQTRIQRAAQIRAELFALRDTAPIPFGDALKYAEAAEKATGVRPAFLLAILKQESNLGQNVGTCNRPGDPESKKWYNIMPGPNDNSWRDDQTIYLRITKALGLDHESMPLSCPWQGGWGGAMGPSQFIPTTWDAYDNRVASALGKSLANPWNPQDAFMASAYYLADLGAGSQTYTAERTAALKYYAGGNWNKPQNAFYGNQVMGHAQDIQENMINPLKNI